MERISCYRVPEIPDASYHQYQVMANGDVLAAVSRNFKHLLRYVSVSPEGSASMSIRFRFTPVPKGKDTQSRMDIHLLTRTHRIGTGKELPILFENGPLGKFYHFEKTEGFEAPWQKIQAICEIVRREDMVMPLHPNDLNDRIPPYYYTISSFDPTDRNDYLNLDRILGSINETVILDMCIEPANVKLELLKHTQYLSLLQSINRIWDHDEDEEPEMINVFADSSLRDSVAPKTITPLRYRDPLADDILRTQQRFHDKLRKPHLLFRIRVLAESPEVAQLIGSVVAESGFENGSYRLVERKRGENGFNQDLSSIRGMDISDSCNGGSLLNGEKFPLYAGLIRLCHLGTVDELSGVFRMPVASQSSPCCIRMNTDPPEEDPQNLIVLGSDEENPGVPRGLQLTQVPKSGFGCGAPGTGKTLFAHNLLLELHRHKIPFLVIEPVKTEYRILKTLRKHPDDNARSLARNLEVYTPGVESISPLRINPLAVYPGISIDEHIENRLWAFKAGMPLDGPMPALLAEGLEKVHQEHPDPENPPQMTDLVNATAKILDGKGYAPEVCSNLRAALVEVRLGMMTQRGIGKVFDCRQSVPTIDQLMKVPALIELDRLHPEQACLITLFILTSIREYLKTVQNNNKIPRYVVIIEEAHNIVGISDHIKTSAENAQPRAHAVDFIARMLAELRAYGVGLFLLDQLPSAVAPEIIKNTSTKLCFRQVADQDRKELGATMLFKHWEIEETARLEPGKSFFYREGYYRPRRINTIDLTKKFDYSIPVLGRQIIPYIQDDIWHRDAAIQRAFHVLDRARRHMDDFDRIRLSMIRELVEFRFNYAQILDCPDTEKRRVSLGDLRLNTLALQKRFSESYRSFLNCIENMRLFGDQSEGLEDPVLKEMKDGLLNRFKSITQPGTLEAQNRIGSFIATIQS